MVTTKVIFHLTKQMEAVECVHRTAPPTSKPTYVSVM